MVNSNFVPVKRSLASRTGALSWIKLDIASLSDYMEEMTSFLLLTVYQDNILAKDFISLNSNKIRE